MWLRFSEMASMGASLRPVAALLAAVLLCHGCGGSGPVVPELELPEGVTADDALAPLVSPAALAAFDDALEAMNGPDPVEAELRLEQFVLEYPQYPGGYVNLAILYERSDVEALLLDQALAIDPANAAANNQLGMLLRKQGQFADAEQAYVRAIETDPMYALAHHNLGVLLDLYLHRPAEALQHYQRYQELLAEPDAAVGRWIIDLQRRLGTNEDTARLAQDDGA